MYSNTIAERFSLRQLVRLVMVVVLAVGLTACGFHLRGNIPLSDGIKNLAVTGPDGRFKEVLEKRLVGLGANLLETEAADVILDLTKVETKRTVATLDERGKANSYNIRLRVNYTLKDASGKAIRPLGRVNESRRYDFDAASVIEAESEEVDLIEDMEDEAVLKLIRRLASITDFDPNATPKEASEG